MAVAAAVLVTLLAAAIVLRDLNPPQPKPARQPTRQAVPKAAAPPATQATPVTPPRDDSVLSSIAEVETDQRTPLGRRFSAALALLVVTLVVAGAVGAGLYRLVRTLG